MAYVTVQQLKDALADAGGAGARTAASLPDQRLAANLAEATGEVTGRLTRSFKLPPPGDDPATSPANIPALMRTIIVGIAGYLATLEFYGTQEVQERDPVVLRYARARELLAAIAGGHLIVDGLDPVGGEGSSATGDAAIYGGVSTGLADVFHPDELDHYRNSPSYFGGVTWG